MRQMKLWSMLAIGVVTLALSTSASSQELSDLNADQLLRLASIEVYQAAPERPYVSLGAVQGVSCNRVGYFASGATNEDAVQQAKVAAVLLGADAIAAMTCSPRNRVDWRRNCNSTIVCAGVAVRFTDEPTATVPQP